MKKSWFISIAMACTMLMCSTSFAADTNVGMTPEPAYDSVVFVDTGPGGLILAVIDAADISAADRMATACMATSGSNDPTETYTYCHDNKQVIEMACGDDAEPKKPMKVPIFYI